jgi:hypothetical protein
VARQHSYLQMYQGSWTGTPIREDDIRARASSDVEIRSGFNYSLSPGPVTDRRTADLCVAGEADPARRVPPTAEATRTRRASGDVMAPPANVHRGCAPPQHRLSAN